MKHCKVVLCIVLAFIDIICVRGQSPVNNNVYEGYVISSVTNTKLEDVICQALDSDKRATDYIISDRNGFFSLKIQDNTRFIQFRLLGYTTLVIPIKETYANQTIKLSESSVNLREVVVSVPPIQSTGDTLKYNVNSFKGQEDRYVSDVLKKLPGIKVADNGTISYMGESINKFYIEGRDLLGGQYNIATNNLDVNAVSTIEVLENNQHIKALKGVDFSEKSAINVRLKKGYKARPFGEIQIGTGGEPFLYDGKMLATYLGENTQTLVNVKGQNNGEFILNELDDKLDINDLFSFEPLVPAAVTAPSARYIPLPTKRHLFNKTYLGSANTLIPVSQNSELKINIAYGADNADQNFTLLQNFPTGGELLQITERSKQKDKINNVRSSIIYEHNSMSKFIKNEATYYYKRKHTNSEMNTIENEKEENVSILGANKVHYIQNNFQSLFKLKNDKTITINSFLRYEDNKDDLERLFVPATDLNELFKTQYLINKNRISSSFSLFNNRLDMGVYTIYKHKKMANDLQLQLTNTGVDMDPYQNTQTEHLQMGLDPTYQIKTNNSSLFFKIVLPVAYSKYRVENSNDEHQADERIIFSPSLSNTYQISHQWETYATFGYRFDYLNDISLLNTPYFTGYRAIYIPSNTFNSNKSIYVSGRIRYKDIVDMFFFNMSILYRISKYNYISVFYNTNEYSYYTTQKQANRGRQFSVMSDVSKTFASCKLSVTINPMYTRLTSNIIQQDIQVKNASNIVSLSAAAEFKGINKLSINYKATGQIAWNENNMTDKTPMKNLTQSIGIYYFPNKNIDLSVISDYVIYEKEENEYLKSFFLDFKGTYRHKRMEYGFIMNNLLNNSRFSLTEFSSINTYSQQVPLRKRDFLLFVKFKF